VVSSMEPMKYLETFDFFGVHTKIELIYEVHDHLKLVCIVVCICHVSLNFALAELLFSCLSSQ
jgi:hypothetical protein